MGQQRPDHLVWYADQPIVGTVALAGARHRVQSDPAPPTHSHRASPERPPQPCGLVLKTGLGGHRVKDVVELLDGSARRKRECGQLGACGVPAVERCAAPLGVSPKRELVEQHAG
jgi:hypothetical protein